MFKIVKYYMLLSLYRRVKKNIIVIVISVLIMILTSYIFIDLIEMLDKSNKFGFIAIKWLILILLFVVIVVNMLKIMKTLSEPFGKEQNDQVLDETKERILAKKYLMSRSDLILRKYRNTK